MRKFKSWGISGLVLCLVVLLLCSLPLAANFKSGTDKFDAVIKLAKADNNGGQRLARLTHRSDKATLDNVQVLVLVQDDAKELSAFLDKAQGKLLSVHGKVISVSLPFNKLDKMASLSSVKKIEASIGLINDNNIAKGEIGVDINSVVEANPNYTGRGVIIGLIDTGIDTTNKAFLDKDGKSRILYYWEQGANNEKDSSLYPTVVTPEGETRTYEYGAEYTAAQIDSGDYINLDEGAHGTSVAGCAGGDDGIFSGTAPEAKFMIVSNESDGNSDDMWFGAGTGSTLDAYEYLISRAKEMNMPLVINQSQGTCMGPHDGSTLFEQALEADINSTSRNLIACISSGNNGLADKAAQVTVAPGQTGSLSSKVICVQPAIADDALYSSIDVWTSNNAELDLHIERYQDNNFTEPAASADIPYLAEGTYDLGTDITGTVKHSIEVAKELPSATNGDDRFLLYFRCSRTGMMGYYKLSFTNKSAATSQVNLYLQRNTSSAFIDNICGATIAMPASTPGVITVGAFTTRTSWTDVNGEKQTNYNTLEDLAPFSSQGPMRSTARYQGLNALKPDICAPGCGIATQMSAGGQAAEADFLPDGLHVVMSGTSFSTPLTSGLVACILQEMPNATAAQVKEILFDSARKDSYTGNQPNNKWGHGKVDAVALNSNKIVAPLPKITGLNTVTDSVTDLVVEGSGFTPSMEVYLGEDLVDSARVEYISSNKFIIKKVLDIEAFEFIRVVNIRGKQGANTALFTNPSYVAPHGNYDAGSGTSGCFIATAAYGSYLEPEVMTLRRFRDRSLLTNAPGREFVHLYYTYSPGVASYIAQNDTARFAVRCALTPMVYSVRYPKTALFLGLLLLGIALGVSRRRMKKCA